MPRLCCLLCNIRVLCPVKSGFLPVLIPAARAVIYSLPVSLTTSFQPYQHHCFGVGWSEKLTLSIWPPRDGDYIQARIKGNLILSPPTSLPAMFANPISSCCLQFQKHFPFSLGLIPATSVYCYNHVCSESVLERTWHAQCSA